MLNISIIVAMDKNRAIGSNNKLLWHLPNDLKHFKKVTMGKPIIMGRKTFESIGRPLPGRENIVVTSNQNWSVQFVNTEKTSISIYHSIDKLLEYIQSADYSEVFIIGGGEIYKQFLNKANKIYLTLVDAEYTADTFFPELNQDWEEVFTQEFQQDDAHKYNYKFVELIKKYNK